MAAVNLGRFRTILNTFDAVHGQQQLSLFNAHYDERCFLPIHIYEGTTGKPVAMILREGKTPSGKEVRTILKHVIKRIRSHWPKVAILVRGDSHYGRDEAMEWCKNHDVDYVFGFAGNDVLHVLTREAADAICVQRALSANPSHRRLLAPADDARRRPVALAVALRRVQHPAPSSDQDRRARGGRRGSHPCLLAHRLSRPRCLPRTRRTALRRRAIANAAPSPQPLLVETSNRAKSNPAAASSASGRDRRATPLAQNPAAGRANLLFWVNKKG